MHHIEGREKWEEVLHIPSLPHFKSSDIKWKQWWSTKPTKLHLSYQDVTLASLDGNWTRLCEEGSGWVHQLLGVEGKASLSLTAKDGKVTLAFSTTLGHLSTPLKPPPVTSPKAPSPGPPAPGRTSSYWTSRSWTSSSWTSSFWTSSSWTSCLTAAPMRAMPAREGLVKGKPQLTQQLHRCCLLCQQFQKKILSANIVSILSLIIRT